MLPCRLERVVECGVDAVDGGAGELTELAGARTYSAIPLEGIVKFSPISSCQLSEQL